MVSVVVILGRNLPIVKHTTPRILTGTKYYTEPLFSHIMNTREQKTFMSLFTMLFAIVSVVAFISTSLAYER